MKIWLANIFLRTVDLQKSRAFYEKLGMKFQEKYLDRELHHIYAEVGNITIGICGTLLAGHVPKVDISQMCFEVEDLDETIKLFSEEEIIQQPRMSESGYTASIRDPEKREIFLVQKNKGKISD